MKRRTYKRPSHNIEKHLDQNEIEDLEEKYPGFSAELEDLDKYVEGNISDCISYETKVTSIEGNRINLKYDIYYHNRYITNILKTAILENQLVKK